MPRRLLVSACLALTLAACGKGGGEEAAARPPEEVAAEVLEANREGALACKRLGEAAEAQMDEGLRLGDEGAGAAITAARTGKIGATMCLAQWSQRTMQALTAAGVPGPMAKQALQDWVAANVGGVTAPVY